MGTVSATVLALTLANMTELPLGTSSATQDRNALLFARSSGSRSPLAGSGGPKPLDRAKRTAIRYLGGATCTAFVLSSTNGCSNMAYTQRKGWSSQPKGSERLPCPPAPKALISNRARHSTIMVSVKNWWEN
eukprot:7302140-Pyramimonas_sp.AAC.2